MIFEALDLLVQELKSYLKSVGITNADLMELGNFSQKPQFLDEIIMANLQQQGDFPQLGGIRGKTFRGFLPTVATALFLVAGDDLRKQFQTLELFSAGHLFLSRQVIYLGDSADHEPGAGFIP